MANYLDTLPTYHKVNGIDKVFRHDSEEDIEKLKAIFKARKPIPFTVCEYEQEAWTMDFKFHYFFFFCSFLSVIGSIGYFYARLIEEERNLDREEA